MKSLNIDVILPWEIGLTVVLISIVLIFFGIRQEKIKNDDFDNIPLTKGTTKIFFGSAFLIFGLINSKILSPFNKAWIKFGEILGLIIAPIIMALVYFIIINYNEISYN